MAERPDEKEVSKWHRWFAVDANNRAWRLSERDEPSEEERAEARLAAFASVFHWSKVGNEENRALAEILLARVHVLTRDADSARRHAETAFRYFGARESEPWQMAFAHAAMADAAALAGDSEKHYRHYELARGIGDALGEEDRSIFLATFDRIPKPEQCVPCTDSTPLRD